MARVPAYYTGNLRASVRKAHRAAPTVPPFR